MKIVDYWAPWCGPCRMVAPVLDKISADYGIVVEKVNIDDNPDTLTLLGISSIPAIIKYDDDGKEMARVVGAKPYKAMVEALGL